MKEPWKWSWRPWRPWRPWSPGGPGGPGASGGPTGQPANNRMWSHKPQTYALWEAYHYLLSNRAEAEDFINRIQAYICSIERSGLYLTYEKNSLNPHLDARRKSSQMGPQHGEA